MHFPFTLTRAEQEARKGELWIGGRYEPVGNDFKGSTIKVLEGAEYVPGLVEALK